jgi:hypothetical protein
MLPMADAKLPRGIVPPGTYAKGGRSPIVHVLLCPPCAGYAPTTDEDYIGFLSNHCQGCGAWSREVHRFQALILSAANGGCMCDSGYPQVTGDLPTEESAMAVLTEVRTRPAPRSAVEQAFIDGGQAFCGNDNCTLLLWDPTKSLDDNLLDAGVVKLPPMEGGGDA